MGLVSEWRQLCRYLAACESFMSPKVCCLLQWSSVEILPPMPRYRIRWPVLTGLPVMKLIYFQCLSSSPMLPSIIPCSVTTLVQNEIVQDHDVCRILRLPPNRIILRSEVDSWREAAIEQAASKQAESIRNIRDPLPSPPPLAVRNIISILTSAKPPSPSLVK